MRTEYIDVGELNRDSCGLAVGGSDQYFAEERRVYARTVISIFNRWVSNEATVPVPGVDKSFFTLAKACAVVAEQVRICRKNVADWTEQCKIIRFILLSTRKVFVLASVFSIFIAE
mmetsp:Transcript_24230/g.45081  ORF Transcript_24230/g.45081 Transcript_24230/m.45081 type:complete len:116 (-) Transcript_24230:1306-1653(-)